MVSLESNTPITRSSPGDIALDARTPDTTGSTVSPSPEKRRSRTPAPIETTNFVTEYDPQNHAHREGFINLLIEQGQAHGREITKDRADAVSTMIGREFEVTLLCGRLKNSVNAVKGMTVTKEADYGEGRLLFLEDIVVTETARGQGLARQLICRNLIDSWNGGLSGWDNGLDGYAWETGIANKSAGALYRKIDSTFSVDIPQYVWRLSARQSGELLHKAGTAAKLATVADLNIVTDVLKAKPAVNFDRVVHILQRQVTNGITEDSFILSTQNAGLAIASEAYSTFEQGVRADVRLYLQRDFNPAGVIELIKGVSSEVARRRRWQGFTSIHIEIMDNATGIDSSRAQGEAIRLTHARTALESINAELLIHDGNPMIAYSLTGTRYVQAVVDAAQAANNKINATLTPIGRERLIVQAKKHGISFG